VSRIYNVSAKATGVSLRYVRANSLNAAVRAYAHEVVVAKAMTPDEVYAAMKEDREVLDAVAPEQPEIGAGNE
jgi:hypothetical protein